LINFSVYTELSVDKESNMTDPIYPLEFLYDGSCPICRADAARLSKADRYGRLIFIDITAPDFDPQEYGRSQEALFARIHARRADGKIVEGPEVIRLSMTAVGMGWLATPSRWPLLSHATDLSYSWFARHRRTLSRHLGGLYTWLTPECDSVCQQFEQAKKAEPTKQK
jgi:predicted DCC family thiol-disulfide oxidoreductase YuxK